MAECMDEFGRYIVDHNTSTKHPGLPQGWYWKIGRNGGIDYVDTYTHTSIRNQPYLSGDPAEDGAKRLKPSAVNSLPNSFSTIEVMAPDHDLRTAQEGCSATQEDSSNYKFVGPYHWVLYTKDGTVTSAWAFAGDSDSDEDASPNRTFSRASMTGQVEASNILSISSYIPPHRIKFQRARELFDELRDDVWEALFNRYVETSLIYFGEEDKDIDKERHQVKEMFFDETRVIYNALEKR
ncbi:uncharacterized protein PAC_13093 [Phialocephala subalpina]|uniref:Uncharacterized protein n=1 Tax=Phialocephala subalpina TaxID=576137 RepID=A0A1L7XDY0_9HELO|nr:uncharacterized protein PAC_13093 [Phialocephala subalpina]